MTAPTAMTWTLEDAVSFCTLVEQHAPAYGCHIALTGGCLYKRTSTSRFGGRRDCDVLFYRVRQVEEIDYVGLFEMLQSEANVHVLKPSSIGGWCVKCEVRSPNSARMWPQG